MNNMIIIIKNKDTLILDDFELKCCIGKNGFSQNKIEGDKKTPKGHFNIGSLYYREDRIKIPKSFIFSFQTPFTKKKFINKLELNSILHHQNNYQKFCLIK